MYPYGPIISFFFSYLVSGNYGVVVVVEGVGRGGRGTHLFTIKNPPIVKTLCNCLCYRGCHHFHFMLVNFLVPVYYYYMYM